jgi:glutathione S-transferase
MPTLTLYHSVQSRGAIARWMLEEVGEPYEMKLLNLGAGDNRKPEFLALNPMGKVPVLTYGEAVISESAAICAFLADEFPKAKLNIPVGDPRRGAYLKWMFFGAGPIEQAVTDRAFPRKEEPRKTALGYGDFERVMETTANAVAKTEYLLGGQFTAADVVVGSQVRFGMMFKMIPERKEFVDYTARLAARPALQRAQQKDQALMQS